MNWFITGMGITALLIALLKILFCRAMLPVWLGLIIYVCGWHIVDYIQHPEQIGAAPTVEQSAKKVAKKKVVKAHKRTTRRAKLKKINWGTTTPR